MSKSTSKSSKSKGNKAQDENIRQFCDVTGATSADAKKFLDKYKRVDLAIDNYFADPAQFGVSSSKKSDSQLNTLFDNYKEPDADDILTDGTIKLCEDLEVNPEDVVLLAVAYELKSPSMGVWKRKGWVDGWKTLGCESIGQMKAKLPQLSQKLASDSQYFQHVYSHAFDFARSEGQRSLGLEIAQGLWAILLPHGLTGGALSHVSSTDDDGDDAMDGIEQGWKEEYNDLWFEFLAEKGGKGVSKDTWVMFLEFVRAIDSKFKNYDETAAWPSTIDDFVAWVREKLATTGR